MKIVSLLSLVLVAGFCGSVAANEEVVAVPAVVEVVEAEVVPAAPAAPEEHPAEAPAESEVAPAAE